MPRLTPAQVEILRRTRDNSGVWPVGSGSMDDVAMLGHYGLLTASQPPGTKVLTEDGRRALPMYE